MTGMFRKVVVMTAIASALTGLTACSSTPPVTFTNPMKDIGNDPYVIQQDGYYYLAESWADGLWVTRSSKDNLTDIAWAGERVKVWSRPLDGPNCAELWAPELYPIGDRWYIYYSASTCDDETDWNHRMFVLESDSPDPLGTYHDVGKITDQSDLWAIDGTRFEWHGKAYFVWSGRPDEFRRSQDLYIAEMASPTQLIGTRVKLSSPDYRWESSDWPTNEGPEALVTADAVFLVYSANFSAGDHYCYGMLTARSDDLLNPDAWQKSPTPVFEGNADVISPGHGTFVKSPDGKQWWMVYHSARRAGSGWDRVMSAQPFTWKNGAPAFGTPVTPGVAIPVPSGQVKPAGAIQ